MIDGLAYLLVTESRGAEYVIRYSMGDIAEVFTADERSALARDGVVIRGSSRWVNMIAAARACADGTPPRLSA